MIDDEIASTPTPRQSQVALNIEMSKTDDDKTEEQQVRPTLNPKIISNKLYFYIIHMRIDCLHLNTICTKSIILSLRTQQYETYI